MLVGPQVFERFRAAPRGRVQDRPHGGCQGILAERRRQVSAPSTRAAHGGSTGEDHSVLVSPGPSPRDRLQRLVLLPEQPPGGRATGHYGAAPLLAAHRAAPRGLHALPRAVRLPVAARTVRAARPGDERQFSALHPHAAPADVPGPETGGDGLSRGAALRLALPHPSHTDREDSSGPAAPNRWRHSLPRGAAGDTLVESGGHRGLC